MNGDAVLEVLREIRDEAKQTNARLDALTGEVGQTNTRLDALTDEVGQTNSRLDLTNTRLAALEGRTEFLERRVTAGFDKVAEQIELVWRGVGESETRVATEILNLAAVTSDVKSLLVNANLNELKNRVAALEQHLFGRTR